MPLCFGLVCYVAADDQYKALAGVMLTPEISSSSFYLWKEELLNMLVLFALHFTN